VHGFANTHDDCPPWDRWAPGQLNTSPQQVIAFFDDQFILRLFRLLDNWEKEIWCAAIPAASN
jgi:hypothetical protein